MIYSKRKLGKESLYLECSCPLGNVTAAIMHTVLDFKAPDADEFYATQAIVSTIECPCMFVLPCGTICQEREDMGMLFVWIGSDLPTRESYKAWQDRDEY